MMYDQAYLIDKDDPRVNGLFSKTFALAKDENYSLPYVECLFKESSWNIAELQLFKDQLNTVKNYLNSYNLSEWHTHTDKRNKARLVQHYIRRDIQPEFLTQAWCKFYEILSFFDIVPENEIIENYNSSFTSVHLCEAPGAFIASLNHWLKTNTSLHWNWIATTLNPYYEGNPLSRMINDDRFIRNTLDHWFFGEDNTGNLMRLKNLDKLVEKAKAEENNILLVTADGSIDCIDVPGEQETVVAHLHYCETIAALHLLSEGGSFVIKIFTIFEHFSVCLLYLLTCCFDQVDLKKPATSKEGNSETYVVCKNFKRSEYVVPYLSKLREYYECGPKMAIFCKNDIPRHFIFKIIDCSRFFKEAQTSVIMENITSFSLDNKISNSTLDEIRIIQELVAEKYITDCNLEQLLPCQEIVGKDVLRKTVTIDTCKRELRDSYDKRCEKANMDPKHRLIQYWNLIREIFNEVPMFESESFQFYNEKVNYDFIIGKAFYKVYNSRFCETRILNVQNDIEYILDKLHFVMHFPSNEDVKNLLEKIRSTSNYKVLTFRYTGIYYNVRVISQFCKLLPTLLDGDTVVLIGYSLLTCFNISFLYLLSYTFHSLKLKRNDKVGCLIILKHYENKSKVLQLLKKINIFENDARRESKTILSFIPITDLYGWAAYPKIVKCNHWIVKTYLNYVMDNVQKTIKHNNDEFV